MRPSDPMGTGGSDTSGLLPGAPSPMPPHLPCPHPLALRQPRQQPLSPQLSADLVADGLLLMYLIYIITSDIYLALICFLWNLPARSRSEAWQGPRMPPPLPGASECHLSRRTQPWPSLGTMHRASYHPVSDGYQRGSVATHQGLTGEERDVDSVLGTTVCASP